jgi:hypothetical protein
MGVSIGNIESNKTMFIDDRHIVSILEGMYSIVEDKFNRTRFIRTGTRKKIPLLYWINCFNYFLGKYYK